MLLKKKNVMCLLSLFFLCQTTQSTSDQGYEQSNQIAPQKACQYIPDIPETIISVTSNNVKFFAAQPPHNKIRHTGQELIAHELLSRYTPETDAWYAHDCEHNKLLNNLVDTVITYFKVNNLAHKNNKQKIIVFDIDDTIMTFYKLYLKKADHAVKNNIHIVSKTPTNEELYQDTCLIRPMFRLYQFFIASGFKIAFVTARLEEYRKLTQDQLKFFGYTTYDHLYLLPTTWEQKQKDSYKEWAREQLSQSYEIIATLDDDWRNLTGKHVGHCAVWIPTIFEQRPEETEFFKSLETMVCNHKTSN